MDFGYYDGSPEEDWQDAMPIEFYKKKKEKDNEEEDSDEF